MLLRSAFQVGDRVSTARTLGIIPKGSQGTIAQVFAFAQCSDVRFDAFPGLRMVRHGDLLQAEQPLTSEPR